MQPPARQAHPAIGCTWGGKPPSVGLFIDDSLTNPLGGLMAMAYGCSIAIACQHFAIATQNVGTKETE